MISRHLGVNGLHHRFGPKIRDDHAGKKRQAKNNFSKTIHKKRFLATRILSKNTYAPEPLRLPHREIFHKPYFENYGKGIRQIDFVWLLSPSRFDSDYLQISGSLIMDGLGRCLPWLQLVFKAFVKETTKSRDIIGKPQKLVAGVAGLEPVTSAVTGQRSNQLSYTPAGVGACCTLRQRRVNAFVPESFPARGRKVIRAAAAKEVGVENPAEETATVRIAETLRTSPLVVNGRVLRLPRSS